MVNFQVTKLNSKVFTIEDIQSFKKKAIFGNNDEGHTVRFKAWDDDGYLYFEGTCLPTEHAFEMVADWVRWDSGCTRVRFYDRSSGRFIDEIS